MRLKTVVRFVGLSFLLSACSSDARYTVDYTVRVIGIEIVPKGAEEGLHVEGLPSASGRLVAPNQGRYFGESP